MQPLNLATFLKRPADSVARERLLHLKAVYEMRLFAAQLGEQIQITEPEIDNNGHDFTLIRGNYGFPIQNKAAIRPGGARQWSIRAGLLQAAYADRDLVPNLDGQAASGYSDGASGGVLLHLVDRAAAEAGELKVGYAYLDIFLIIATAAGICLNRGFSAAEAKELLRRLRDARETESVTLPERWFLGISSPAAVVDFRLGVRPNNYVSCCCSGNELETQAPPDPCIADNWRRYVDHWRSDQPQLIQPPSGKS